METTESTPRQTPTGNGSATIHFPRKRFDPTQLFAQRDRLPWFWFFVAVAVTIFAAFDRYHLIQQFKQRERVVIIDPSQTYYISQGAISQCRHPPATIRAIKTGGRLFRPRHFQCPVRRLSRPRSPLERL
jgi:hypothetical protein